MERRWRNEGLTQPLEQNRMLPMLALSFAFGIWLAFETRVGLWPLLLAPIALLTLAGLTLCRLPKRYALIPLAIMIGLLYTQRCLSPVTPPTGKERQITATVFGTPKERENGRVTATLCDLTIDGERREGKAYGSLMSVDKPLPTLFDGAKISFTGTVYLPSPKENEYDFDFRLWMLQNGMTFGVSGYAGAELLNTAQNAPVADWTTRIRTACRQKLVAVMGDEGETAMAMLLGDREGMAEDEQQAFREAGVAHVMSVSGLHVGLLAGVLGWLLNKMRVNLRLQLPIMAGFLLGYCLLTGFAAASLRAATMVLLVSIARALGRKSSPFTLLSTAAIVVLAMDPLQLMSAGFALSFSTMAGIFLLNPPLIRLLSRLHPPKARQELKRRNGFRGWLHSRYGNVAGAIATDLSAQIGSLLPTAAYFHRIPTYGLLFNLVAVPLVGLLVPMYAVTLLLALCPLTTGTLAVAVGWIAKQGTRFLYCLLGLVNDLPFASVRLALPSTWVVVGFAAVCLMASTLLRAEWKRRALALLMTAAVVCVGAAATQPEPLRYHQFAVGQGDAAMIADGSQTILIDVGEDGYEVADRLLAENRDVDALILTHLHLDHAQGVRKLVEEGIGIRRAYLPESVENSWYSDESRAVETLLRESDVPITYLSAGDRLAFGHTTIDVLWPRAGTTRPNSDANLRSLALLIRLDGVRLLSMADNSSMYEEYFATDCDVLKAGHHGSATSTSDAFLAQTTPSAAIITCRTGNQSLPSQDTLERLTRQGVAIYRTDVTGELTITVANGGYRIQTFRAGEDD